MRDVNSTFTTEKNKQVNKPIRLYTVYDYDDANGNLYLAEYHENVSFAGQTYVRFPITIDKVGSNMNGEVDGLRVTLANVSRLVQGYLENYEWRGKKLRIQTVFADQLADASACITDEFYIDSITADASNVSLTLTSKFDLLDLELPRRRYMRNNCAWKFKSEQCGYAGVETECNKTLARCRVLNNQLRFGAFPSIPARRVSIV
jgi:lambda family phage minor tail protein L